MTRSEFKALMALIDARVEMNASSDVHESVRYNALEDDFLTAFVKDDPEETTTEGEDQ